MNLSLEIDSVCVQPVVLIEKQPTAIDILRLDKIHPVVSGNKWFKLKEWLDIAIRGKKGGLFTAGGAFSNHLVATAYAARSAGLPSAALVRGEPGKTDSPAILDAQKFGMTIHYTSRDQFKELMNNPAVSKLIPSGWLSIPSGGAGPPGVKGAAGILQLVPNLGDYTHIICSVGTGTMLAGLSNAAFRHQQILGITTLKGNDLLSNQVRAWQIPTAAPFQIIQGYDFGGYGRKNDLILAFMNTLFERNHLPTDFVYTGKMMFAIKDLLQKGYFKNSDRILAIHSGGLQGNRSLKKGQLIFL